MSDRVWGVRIRRERVRGTGAVVSPTLVLTCEHVTRGARTVEVRLPSGDWKRFQVIDEDALLDVALLRTVEAMGLVEHSVLVPRLLSRGAPPLDTVAELCTDDPGTPRSLPVTLRRAPSSAHRVQFDVVNERQGIWRGHSGGPIVEHDLSLSAPRMVGVVRARDERSLDAFDRAGVGWMTPMDAIAERFDDVASLVETPVERDSSWWAHWEPRSRGVATYRDAGFFFSGRQRATERVREHLDHGSGLLVVTGQRGSGKSALLARTVAVSRRRYAALLGDDAGQLGVGDGVVGWAPDAAVLARGHAPGWVAEQIALQLGYGPCDPEDLTAQCLSEERAPRIIVDAVDESEDPRTLIRDVVGTLANAGAAIVIGALRRRISSLDLPQQTTWVDLDGAEYGDDAIYEYVVRRLVDAYGVQAARTVAREVFRARAEELPCR